MNQKRQSTRLLVAALTALLMSSLVGASGFVLCLGSDGHREIEVEHTGTVCPSLVSSHGTATSSLSLQATAECSDFPTSGNVPTAPSSFEPDRVSPPPLVFLAAHADPIPRIEALLRASTDARAGPPSLAPHLTSTVLLV